MRLGQPFIGTTRCMEYRRHIGGLKRAIQSAARFAGRDRQPEAGRAEALQRSICRAEELHLVITGYVVVAIALGKLRIPIARQIGEQIGQRVVQSQADNVPRLLVTGDLQLEVGRCSLQRFSDMAGRIHHRPIPIENQQIEAFAHLVLGCGRRLFAGIELAQIALQLLGKWRRNLYPLAAHGMFELHALRVQKHTLESLLLQ